MDFSSNSIVFFCVFAIFYMFGRKHSELNSIASRSVFAENGEEKKLNLAGIFDNREL